MKKFILITSVIAAVFFFGLSESRSQQKSIVVLIRTSLNGASECFPSLLKDTIPASGEWKYKIKPGVVKEFADVNDIDINITQNFNSPEMNDAPFQINRMRIISDVINVPPDLSRGAYLDSVLSRYNKVVSFFRNELGEQFRFTDILQPQTGSGTNSSLNYIIYFYENKTALPGSIMDTGEIEKFLETVTWFSVELHNDSLNSGPHHIEYRINGSKKL